MLNGFGDKSAIDKLSSDAAETMTGEALPMDGGWLAQ